MSRREKAVAPGRIFGTHPPMDGLIILHVANATLGDDVTAIHKYLLLYLSLVLTVTHCN